MVLYHKIVRVVWSNFKQLNQPDGGPLSAQTKQKIVKESLPCKLGLDSFQITNHNNYHSRIISVIDREEREPRKRLKFCGGDGGVGGGVGGGAQVGGVGGAIFP